MYPSTYLFSLLHPTERERIVRILDTDLRSEDQQRSWSAAALLVEELVDIPQDHPDAAESLTAYLQKQLLGETISSGRADVGPTPRDLARVFIRRPSLVRHVLQPLRDLTDEETLINFLTRVRQPDLLTSLANADLETLLSVLLSQASSSGRSAEVHNQSTSLLLQLFATQQLKQSEHLHVLSEFATSIWERIESLLADVTLRKQAYAGYLLWARWLGVTSLPATIICQNEYWRKLRLGLLDGDTATQKVCLHILRHSVSLLEHDLHCEYIIFEVAKRQQCVDEFDRFCTIFEIIVIEQYPNQVEACLAGLTGNIFAGERSHVDHVAPTWWFALFTVGLNVKALDSVRALIGNWILQTGLGKQSSDLDCLHFVTASLLPWLHQGQLLAKTLTRVGNTAESGHGDRITRFMTDFLSCCSSDEAREFYREGILDWMKSSWNRLNVHASGYLLIGLSNGIATSRTPSSKLVASVNDFYRVSHRSEIQQQLISRSCLLLTGDDPVGNDKLLIPARENDSPITIGKADIVGEVGRQADDDLASLLAEHVEGRARLRGDSLRRFCERLVSATQAASNRGHYAVAINPADWEHLLSDIWEEIEIQDFPRSVVLLIPELLFFDPLPSDTESPSQTDLSSLQSTILGQLMDLSQGRIYIWNHLARAVRRVFLQCPSIVSSPSFIDFIKRFLNSPPEPKVEFMLDVALAGAEDNACGTPTFKLRFDENEGHAYIMDIINRLNCNESPAAQRLLEDLIKPWISQKVPVPMVSKWKTTAQLQAMVILTESPKVQGELILTLRSQFLQILAIEPLPRFRWLLEWIVTSLSLRLDRGAESVQTCPILESMVQQEKTLSSPKYLGSLIRIAVHLASAESASEEYAERIFDRLVAMAASQKVVVRHEAQRQFCLLYRHVERKGWPIATNRYILSLYRFVHSLEQTMQSSSSSHQLDEFDLSEGRNLSVLFEGKYLQMYPVEEPLFTAADYPNASDEVAIPSEQGSSELTLRFEERNVTTGAFAAVHEPSQTSRLIKVSVNGKTGNGVRDEPVSFQTKARPDQFFDIPSYLLNVDDGSIALTNVQRTTSGPQAILIASLVDKVHNLGGLSRAAEIFGCLEMHVDDAAIVKDKAFTTLSVSSEHHLKIVETKATAPVAGKSSALLDTIEQKKADGWTIIGVEQTSTSFVLGEYTKGDSISDTGDIESGPAEASVKGRLPEKVVFVLGAERTGIPGWLLTYMDDCTEIRQYGFTRSLNVQTACAVVLHEWRRVHGK